MGEYSDLRNFTTTVNKFNKMIRYAIANKEINPKITVMNISNENIMKIIKIINKMMENGMNIKYILNDEDENGITLT